MLDQAIAIVTNSLKTCYIPGTARRFIFFVDNLSTHPVGRYYFHFIDEVHEVKWLPKLQSQEVGVTWLHLIPKLHHITDMSRWRNIITWYKIEQRLAPLRPQPPRSVHKPSWAPYQHGRRFLWRLLLIACMDYCDHIATHIPLMVLNCILRQRPRRQGFPISEQKVPWNPER